MNVINIKEESKWPQVFDLSNREELLLSVIRNRRQSRYFGEW